MVTNNTMHTLSRELENTRTKMNNTRVLLLLENILNALLDEIFSQKTLECGSKLLEGCKNMLLLKYKCNNILHAYAVILEKCSIELKVQF